MKKSKLLGLLPILAILLLSWFPDNPPTGYTGAPLAGGGNEPTCTLCHTPPATQPFAGNVSLSGLPANIDANQTYPLTITLTKTAGDPQLAGFEIVALNSALQNAGTITGNGPNTGIESEAGRTYLEHRPAQAFIGNTVSYTFDWKAPASPNNDLITFYAIGNIASGTNGNLNDLIVTSTQAATLVADTDPLMVNITASSNLTCNGSGDGAATATASGGSGTYTYSWSDGETSNPAISLPAGSVTVTVSDGTNTATASTIISEPPALNASISGETTITCINSTASATVAATGGTPGYAYLWDNGETTATATNLDAGSHQVTVTDDHDCTTSASVFIEEIIDAPTADAGQDQNICQGGTTTLSAFGSGGSTPYTYVWDQGLGAGADQDVTPTITTTYTVTVTGSNGCFDIDEVTIFVTANPTLSLVSADCATNLQTYTVVVNSDGEQVIALDANNQNIGTITNNGNGTFTITNLPAGGDITILAINVTEGDCTTELAITAPDCECPDIPAPNAEGSTEKTICSGENIPLFSAFGQAGQVIDWYDSATGGTLLAGNSPTYQPTAAGTYYAEARDSETGCVSTSRLAFVLTIHPNPSVNITGNTTFCAGESQSLDAGAGFDSYLWSTGASTQTIQVTESGIYSVTVTNTFGCTGSTEVEVTVFSNPTLSLVSADCATNLQTYTVVVNSDGEQVIALDANNQNIGTITNNGNGTFTITNLPAGGDITILAINVTEGDCTTELAITAPDCECPDIPAPNAEGSTEKTICSGENIPLFSAFGQAGQVIDWYDSATGGTLLAGNSPTYQPTAAGTYYAEARDSETGCVSSSRLAFVLTIHPNPSVNITGNTTFCEGESITIEASGQGGTTPYTYGWSNGLNTAIITISPTAAESDCVTVTDANGCMSTECVNITINPAVAINLSITDESSLGATDGSITANVTDGTPPFWYAWTTGMNTATITDLNPGTYCVTVTSADGCIAVQCGTLNAGACPDINVSLNANTPICFGESADIQTNVSGGIPPYTYEWGAGMSTASITVSPATTTTYCVTVTDANGCTGTSCITIVVNPAIEINFTSINESSPGATDGAITAHPTGGSPSYSYLWDTGDTSPTITNLAAGTYCVTITDMMGCSNTNCGIVGQGECEDLLPTVDGLFEICPNSMDGFITITDVSGGTPAYSYNWSTGASDAGISDLVPGTYLVTITDMNGCQSTESFEIIGSDTEAPEFDNCSDQYILTACNIAIFDTPIAFDNCGAVSVEQTEGLTSGETFPDGATTVTFTATDASGNSNTCSFEVVIDPISEFFVETSPEHDMDSDGSATLSFTGGVAPFTFVWMDENGNIISTDQNLVNVPAGMYTFIITDAHECSITGMVEIGNIVAADQLVLNANISISPNPASDQLYISIDAANLEEVTYELYNLQGELITRMIKKSNKIKMDVSLYPKALYLLRISIDGKSVVRKIILE